MGTFNYRTFKLWSSHSFRWGEIYYLDFWGQNVDWLCHCLNHRTRLFFLTVVYQFHSGLYTESCFVLAEGQYTVFLSTSSFYIKIISTLVKMSTWYILGEHWLWEHTFDNITCRLLRGMGFLMGFIKYSEINVAKLVNILKTMTCTFLKGKLDGIWMYHNKVEKMNQNLLRVTKWNISFSVFLISPYSSWEIKK